MSVTTNVNQIKLNIMTKAQYNAATKSASELYMVTDAEDSSIQVDTLPTASVDVLGKIYQYVGTTTASCTNGYFYKCVSDGAVTPTYSWINVEVQPAGDSLPSQTGNAGKFLTTDGTDASWADTYVKVNKPNRTLSVGDSANATGMGGVAINGTAYAGQASGIGSIVIGPANATASGAIQIGGYTSGGWPTNSEQYTLKIAFYDTNYKLLDSDGTIPTDRYTTTPSSDGNYVPTLSISSGTATRSWTSIASSVSSSSTNAETVGAKLFYDTVGDIVTLINAL